MDRQTEVLKDLKRIEEEIKLGEALDRLKVNPDFKKLITDEYLNKLVLDLLYNSNDDNNSAYYSKLDSIKFFKSFLDSVSTRAKLAQEVKPEYLNELNNTNK